MRKIHVLLLAILNCGAIFGQTYSGLIKDVDSNESLEYVNIGIIGKNVGTVSDSYGNYTIDISENSNDDDSIKFSIIGYAPLVLKVTDFKQLEEKNISLKSQIIELNEIIVKPIRTEEKILGNKFNGKKIQGGFRENSKGFECGVLLKIKKRALLEELVCNIAECTYDSVFYRIDPIPNVYYFVFKRNFESELCQSKIEKQFCFQ